MNRLGELIPSEQLLAFLEKAETAISMIGTIEARIGKLEDTLAELRTNVGREPAKEYYQVSEFAAIVKRRPYTVREWCRLGRIHAGKRQYARGAYPEWRISHEELIRYENEGLLPYQRGRTSE